MHSMGPIRLVIECDSKRGLTEYLSTSYPRCLMVLYQGSIDLLHSRMHSLGQIENRRDTTFPAISVDSAALVPSRLSSLSYRGVGRAEISAT
jgi:hypothetical protein